MQKKILTILGDFYHSHDLALTAVVKAAGTLKETAGADIEVVDSSVDNIEEALKQGYDLVVLYKENRLNPNDEIVYNWMNSDIEKQITQYVANGGSWLAWHAGLVSYKENAAYTDMVKGYFVTHPEQLNVKYSTVSNKNGLGLEKDFEVMDEHYFVESTPLENSVFLTSVSAEGQCEAGWAHEYGNGRVCSLTPTHGAEGMTNEDMLSLLAQCIKWSLKL